METIKQLLKTQIEDTQKIINSLESADSQIIETWQPHGGEWWIATTGIVCDGNSDNKSKLHGSEYRTKEQAEWARDQMRRFNRLLAYVAEHDVDENGVQWKPNWKDSKSDKYVVACNSDNNKWFCDVWSTRQEITVHMSKQCAKGLVDKLNSGEVVL